MRTNGKIQRYYDIILVFASIVLLAALSFEIISGTNHHFSSWYLRLQLLICLLFLFDFFVEMKRAKNKMQHIFQRGIILIISIPYLNIVAISNMEPSRGWSLLFGMMPVLRSFVALYVIFRWMIAKQLISRIFYAYIITVILSVYLAALIFYDCEYSVNAGLHNFGDAIWWVWLYFCTVGSDITPITTIGKILSIVMPMLGMMLMPIFTSYILSIYKRQ